MITLIAAVWVWLPEGSDGGVCRAPGCLTTDLLDDSLGLKLVDVIEILARRKVEEANDFCDFCLVGFITLAQFIQRRRTRRWPTTALTVLAIRKGNPHIKQARQTSGGIIGVECAKYQVAG